MLAQLRRCLVPTLQPVCSKMRSLSAACKWPCTGFGGRIATGSAIAQASGPATLASEWASHTRKKTAASERTGSHPKRLRMGFCTSYSCCNLGAWTIDTKKETLLLQIIIGYLDLGSIILFCRIVAFSLLAYLLTNLLTHLLTYLLTD